MLFLGRINRNSQHNHARGPLPRVQLRILLTHMFPPYPYRISQVRQTFVCHRFGEEHVVAVKFLIRESAAHVLAVDGSHKGEAGIGMVERQGSWIVRGGHKNLAPG